MKYAKLLLFLFSLCLLIGLATNAVAAAPDDGLSVKPTAQATFSGGSGIWVNPDYPAVEDVEQPSSDASAAPQATVTYLSPEEAVGAIRRNLVSRATPFTVYMTVKAENLGNRDVTIAFIDDLLAKAKAHTGNPKEGDYLERHILKIPFSWSFNSSTLVGSVTFTPEYLSTAEQEAAVDARISELIEELDLDYASDFQIVKGVYDYMCDTISYDYTSTDNLRYTAYAALFNKTARCQGYGCLFYRLMLEYGIDCRYIRGYGAQGGNHGWNIVALNGVYFNVDATWDAPLAVEGTPYENFLLTDSSFVDHTRRDAYLTADFYSQYPMTTYDYVPLEILRAPQSAEASYNQTVSTSVTANGTLLAYQWYWRPAGTVTWYNSSQQTDTYAMIINTGNSGRQVYCIVTDIFGNSHSTPYVSLNLKPTITVAPQDQYVELGETATVSLTAITHGDATYKWYYKDPASDTFVRDYSQTGASFSYTVTAENVGRQIYCYVYDNFNRFTRSETVTVYSPVTITAQPDAAVFAKYGQSAAVTVAAVGKDLTYQWYVRNEGASSFTRSSIISDTYSVTMSGKTRNRSLYCVITDAFGNTVQTQTFCLRMAATVTDQSGTSYTELGASAEAIVIAEGDGLTYQWYVKNEGATKYSKSSITSSTYSVKMSEASKNRLVYCVVTDQYGNTDRSNTVRLRMAVTITAQSKTTYTKLGSTAKATVEAAGDDLTYQWYIKNVGATKYSKSSITSATYSVKMSDKVKDRLVYCVVTDKYGNTDRTETVRLRMAATVTDQSKTTYTQMGATAKATVTAEGDGLTYQWYIKNAGATKYSKSSITSAIYSCKMSDASKDRLVYCVITDKYGNTDRTETVRLRMAATITTQPTSVSAAQGATATVKLAAVGDGLAYKWYYKDVGASEFKLTNSFTGNSYYVAMNDARNGRQVYCVVTDKYGNTAKSGIVTLSIT